MEYTDKLEEVITLLKEIRNALSAAKPSVVKTTSSGENEQYACDITSEATPSKSGEWLRYQARTFVPGYQTQRFISLWIRANKSENVAKGMTVNVQGRLSIDNKNGKEYYSIFADHVLDVCTHGEQKSQAETEDNDDVPF